MKRSDFHVVQVIPREFGGGAERIVGDLFDGLRSQGQSTERVHFTGKPGQYDGTVRFGLKHNSPRNILRLRQLLQDRVAIHKRVILHSHLTHGFYASSLARANLPVIWVHTEHNTMMRLRKIQSMRPIERQFYLCCDRIVAISQGVEDALLSTLNLPRSKISMIHNGSRQFKEVERAPLANRPLRIVSVGSLNKRKGFGSLLRGLAQAEIGEWRYTIVGAGPERQNLGALALQLGLQDRVTFAGWCDDPAPYYVQADVQIIPSEWEGFGLVAVEGMSTGLRVVASDVAGLREVLGEDPRVRRLVPDHMTPLSWTRALEAEASALRSGEYMGSTHILNRAGQFSSSRMINNHQLLYQELIDQIW